MDRQTFIQQNKSLFRDTPAKNISDDMIVERVLQYGDLSTTGSALRLL